ncbi:MAG: serine hydrolase [Candidatus Sericytochromatia bacterium]
MSSLPHLIKAFALSAVLSLSLSSPTWALPTGQWQGFIQLPGQKLAVLVKLNQDEKGQWRGTIDIPAQNAKDLPLKDIRYEKNKLQFVIAGVPGEPSFEGEVNAEESHFGGQFCQGGQKMAFVLERQSEAQAAQSAEKAQAQRQKVLSTIENLRQSWKTPGLAVAIVKDDQIWLAEGFGLRSLDEKHPVDADTLFAIGSCTKAFTATLLAMLVDEGKLDWDAPVRNYLPKFQLKESYATDHITSRDLLTHVSGLPRHDLAWYGSPYSGSELLTKLKYLSPSADFRARFQYQNLMYMSAGLLAEEITGQSWEQLMQTRFFVPLGMKRSNASLTELQTDPNHALPHRKKGESVQRIPFRSVAAAAPAGAINASANDMAQWLRLNLAQGRLDDKTIVGDLAIKDVLSPQVVMQSRGNQPEIPYMLYGMGWMIHPYRGVQMIQHGGNIDGFSALVSLIPEKKLGIVILSNKDGDALPNLLNLSLTDLLLELEPLDWSGRLKQGLEQAEKISKSTDATTRVAHTKPSHDLSDFAGVYSHPAYGELNIRKEGTNLKLKYNDFAGHLEHWHYDSFVLRQSDSVLDGLRLHFQLNEEGDLERVSVKLEPLGEAIVFARTAPAQMKDPDYLKRYTGQFDMAGLKIKIELKGNALVAHATGQPPFELIPQKWHQFKLKGLDGYQIRFEFKAEKLDKVVFIQPNGSFEAKPVN